MPNSPTQSAGAAPAQTAPSWPPGLKNSVRSIPKATYVPLLPDPRQLRSDQAPAAQALLKSGYLRQLNLQPGEVDAVQKSLSASDALPAQTPAPDANLWSVLRPFEGGSSPAQLPSPSTLANLDQNSLLLFGNALVNIRRQAVQRLQQPSAAPAGAQPSVAPPARTLGTALNLLNTAMASTNAFQANFAVPLGMLHLERLEMTPAGIERGELLATIPLAPKERTSVVQKEWSVTSQEFSTIVTDSLQDYSETGVTENTQLSQATTSQVAHGNQFNITSSAQGGCGFVSGSSAVTFGGQDQTSNSANDSRQHALQTTRKASSRATQSHKTTISTTTVTGTSETTTRMLENPSATDPIRIDYFSFMRKWYVALYRYDMRMTYDITIPEPGAALRKIFQRLAELQAQAAGAFTFNLPYSEITTDPVDPQTGKPSPPSPPGAPSASSNTIPRYLWLANQMGTQVPLAPSPPQSVTQPDHPHTGGGRFYDDLQINVPDGCWITGLHIVIHMAKNDGGTNMRYGIDGGYYSDQDNSGGVAKDGVYSTETIPGSAGHFTLPSSFMLHASGSQTMSFYFQDVLDGSCHIFVTMDIELMPITIQQWQASVWNALYNAAQTVFYANQQLINGQIQTLQNQIANVDTLTLRREENDEIMKCVLRWILQESWEFMPADVIRLFESSNLASTPAPPIVNNPGSPSTPASPVPNNLDYGVGFTGNALPPPPPPLPDWSEIPAHEDEISFINQAIEWENVLYFLYSYFWDIPVSWDFIRQIQHPDKTRQAFLRSGAARVVLTVRKGWEVAWIYYTLTRQIKGSPGALAGNAYMTIAQQIQAYAETNYPGIPPANPNGGGLIDDNTPQFGTTCAQKIVPSPNPTTPAVTIKVADNSQFVVGATAIIDTWDAGIGPDGKGPTGLDGIGRQETQTITAVSAPGVSPQTITIQGLEYEHDGTPANPFPIVQAGAKGTLIGEWFEYTPTSGTDIAVTSNLATIGLSTTQGG